MDPVSFSASLIAILSLTAKLSSKIKQIVDDIKDAPSELAEIRDEIISLTWVLERLKALSEEEQRANSSKPVLWLLEQDAPGSGDIDIEIALRSCATVMKEMGRRLDRVEGYVSGGVLDRIKYPFTLPSEKGDLRVLRTRLAHGKTTILISLHLRTFGLVKAASSASIEHHTAIRELLELVREVKLQNSGHHVPEVVRPRGLTENPLNGEMPTPESENQDDLALGHGDDKRQFELEVYSSPNAWMAKFRKGSEQEEVPVLSEEWHMVDV